MQVGALFAEGEELAPMFDSPFEYCAVCRAYVLLDQTQRQCAREHSCAAVAKCLLQRYFTGLEFREGQEAQGKEESTGTEWLKVSTIGHARLRPPAVNQSSRWNRALS